MKLVKAAMLLFRVLRLMIFALPIVVTASVQGCGGGGEGCCKVCDVGKACGDTCIAANQTCNSPSGCACNK